MGWECANAGIGECRRGSVTRLRDWMNGLSVHLSPHFPLDIGYSLTSSTNSAFQKTATGVEDWNNGMRKCWFWSAVASGIPRDTAFANRAQMYIHSGSPSI